TAMHGSRDVDEGPRSQVVIDAPFLRLPPPGSDDRSPIPPGDQCVVENRVHRAGSPTRSRRERNLDRAPPPFPRVQLLAWHSRTISQSNLIGHHFRRKRSELLAPEGKDRRLPSLWLAGDRWRLSR